MLESTLTTTQAAGAVDLAYTVENAGSDPFELSFPDAQRAEFVAERDDETVWQYSEGRMFAMALGTVALAPGERGTFEATWTPSEPGAYDLRAWLAANDARAEAITTVAVE